MNNLCCIPVETRLYEASAGSPQILPDTTLVIDPFINKVLTKPLVQLITNRKAHGYLTAHQDHE